MVRKAIHSSAAFDFLYTDTVELLLSGLTGMTNHTDMQQMRITGFFFENRLHWQFEVGEKFLQTAVLGYIQGC